LLVPVSISSRRLAVLRFAAAFFLAATNPSIAFDDERRAGRSGCSRPSKAQSGA
jgi:hypothetical protein